MGLPFVRSFALSPLDGASVREAHCEQASTAVREAHCAQATVARLVTFESLKWKSAKSPTVSNKTFLFQ